MAENKDLEGYKISTMEDEEDYFDNVEMELDYSISITEGSMELGKDNIKEQKSTCVTAMETWTTRSSCRTCSR